MLDFNQLILYNNRNTFKFDFGGLKNPWKILAEGYLQNFITFLASITFTLALVICSAKK